MVATGLLGNNVFRNVCIWFCFLPFVPLREKPWKASKAVTGFGNLSPHRSGVRPMTPAGDAAGTQSDPSCHSRGSRDPDGEGADPGHGPLGGQAGTPTPPISSRPAPSHSALKTCPPPVGGQEGGVLPAGEGRAGG